MHEPFADVRAELAVLGGIYQHGGDAFLDCDDLIDSGHFTDEAHRAIYRCYQDFYGENPQRPIDQHSLLSTARKLGLRALDGEDEQRYLRALFNYRTELPTVRREAEKLFKLAIGKELDRRLHDVHSQLERMTGDEPLSEILALVENPIFDYTATLNETEQGVVQIAEGGREWLEDLIANPRENIGIPSPFPKYNALIGGGFRRKTITVIGARRKSGKAQVLDAQVFTPTGPIRMGDVAVGDIVSTPDGRTARVDSIHPQGCVPVYRVVFGDGDSTECTLDHLWEVRHRDKSHYEVMSLGDIVQKGLMRGQKERKWKVRLPDVCFYDSQPVPMEPYLLGLLLGNGGLTVQSPKFTSADDETVDALRQLLPDDHDLVYNGRYDYTIRSGGRKNLIKLTLREMGLWGRGSHDKFIPDVYLYNSREVRLAILQGLLDTDGYAGKRGNTLEYSSASKELAYGVKELVHSLGGLATVAYRQTTCQTGTFWSYRVHIKHDDPTQFFRLSRKRERMTKRVKPPLHRTIKRVEYVGVKPAQCIKLSTDDGLYMTDHHIVTHNTVLCDNVCLHVAGKLGVPVLNIDTEMSQTEHLARIIAHITNIPSTKVEHGWLTKSEAQAARKAMDYLETIPYDYHCVIGRSFEEQVASMRRWAVKKVGVDADGVRNNGLIVHDYLQLTDPREFGTKQTFQEYQLLAFQMVGLLNMAARCDIPVLAMVQLNRDGGIAASDRITWKCSSYSTLSKKEEEEMDGPDDKSLKLVVEVARHGPGCKAGDWININFDGATSRMQEGKTRYELERDKKQSKSGFEIEGDHQFTFDEVPVQQ